MSDALVVDVSRDWAVACGVQQRFMQGLDRAAHALDCSARCRQTLELGGDCYDFVPLADQRLALTIGDASGKGLAAALMIANVQSSLRTAALLNGNDLAALLGVGYWLDFGNGASSAQFVLGKPQNARNKRSRTRLRTVGDLYPEVVDPALDDVDEPSCSAIESLERQHCFVNGVLAQHALPLLARLFRDGQLSHHGGFVDVATSRAVPLPIDPLLWRRVRRKGAVKRVMGVSVSTQQ